MKVWLQSGLQEAQTGRGGADFEESNEDGGLGEGVPHAGFDGGPAVKVEEGGERQTALTQTEMEARACRARRRR